MLADEIERTRRGAVRKRMPQTERYGPVGIVRRGSTNTDAERHPAVRRAVEYIRRHAFEEAIRLDGASTGMTMREYRNRQRKSKEHNNGNKPIPYFC